MKDFFLTLVKQKGGFKPLHAHLDKSNIISPALLKKAQSVSMQDKWFLYRDIKANYTFDDVYQRSEKSLKTIISQGATVIRTFVDADAQVGQMCIDSVSKLKQDYKHLIDIEIAIQPLEGVVDPKARIAFETACSKADLVGGLPS